MATRRKKSGKSRSGQARLGSKKKSENTHWLPILGGVIVVLIVIGIIWFALGSHAKPTTTTNTVPVISSSTGAVTSNQGSSGTQALNTNALLSAFAAYPQHYNFTAKYVGHLTSLISSTPGPIIGNFTIEYVRHGDFALSNTVITSNQVGDLSTSIYYSNNSSVSCIANSTGNYSCEQGPSAFNSSNFGLSVFLSALSNSSAAAITTHNSSYSGIRCIAVSELSNSSYNSTEAVLLSNSTVSGCIQPAYRIPLELNMSRLITIHSMAMNGSAPQSVSESLVLNLHIVNLTNSSSQADVGTMPSSSMTIG